MNGGWIKLWRKIRDNEFYRERRIFSKYEAWLDMLLMANHEDNSFLMGGEIIQCQRGSFVTSETKLANQWCWSRHKIRDFLMLCESLHMVVKKTDTKRTTISVINYDTYQTLGTEKEQKKDNERTTKGQRKDTNKNDKKEKNDKKRKNKLSNEEFLSSLKEKYPWVDMDKELVKMDGWILLHPQRKKTRRFIVNWLSNIDRPLEPEKKGPPSKPASTICKFCKKEVLVIEMEEHLKRCP